MSNFFGRRLVVFASAGGCSLAFFWQLSYCSYQIYAVLSLFFSWRWSPSVFGGGLLGYIIYDVSHYFIHHGSPIDKLTRRIKVRNGWWWLPSHLPADFLACMLLNCVLLCRCTACLLQMCWFNSKSLWQVSKKCVKHSFVFLFGNLITVQVN